MEATLRRGLPLTPHRHAERERLAHVVARVQGIVLGGGAFLLPLAVLWTASDTYILPKLLVARALVLTLAALWLLRGAFEGRLVMRRTPLDIALLMFVVSAGISTVFAVNRNLALVGAYDRYEGFLTIVLYATLYWLTVQTLASAQSARRVIRALLISGYVAAIFSIAQSLLASAHGIPSGESAFDFAGVARAEGTMGNPNLLATFLAMLLPIVLDKLLTAASWLLRLAWLNVLIVMSLALILTFGRAAIIAAVLAMAIVGLRRMRPWARPKHLIAPIVSLLITSALLVIPAHGGLTLGRSILDRVESIADPTAGSNATRIHVWQDTLRLIAARPLAGIGPDNFGLVYPRFESGDWTPGYRIDKAHADALQVAATQGLLGLVSYLALLLGAITMFWRTRRMETIAVFAGWLAYQVTTQVNFSWLPAAAPFWLFLGAAAVLCLEPRRRFHQVAIRRWKAAAAVIAAGAALALLGPAVIRPYQAEADFSTGLQAELRADPATSLTLVEEARRLSTENPVYAVEAGNLFVRAGSIENARQAFKNAIELGSEDPSAYRSLAIIDQLAGHNAEAAWAASAGFQLDPFDPASRELLNQTIASS
jgi:O-antigen ligase